MEENTGLFVDPEEDEVFFYGVTEKEVQKKRLLESKSELDLARINESRWNQNDHTLKANEGHMMSESSLNTFTVLMGLEEITDLNYLKNSCNFLTVPFPRDLKNKNMDEKCTALSTYQGSFKTQAKEEHNGSPIKQITTEKRKFDESSGMENNINVCIDHNYSTPVKTIIDKSILKTPKSVVKADKDGGFLKVLSEIALVMAEADQNNLGDIKKLTAIPAVEELNDDDKENKQSDNEKTHAASKTADVSLVKSNHGLIVNVTISEGQKKIINSCSPEKLSEEHVGFPTMYDLDNIKISETANENIKHESFKNEITSISPMDELCLVKSLSLNEHTSNDSNIDWEKQNSNLIYNELMKEREIEKSSNSHELKVIDFVQGVSYNRSIELKGTENLKETCCSEKNCPEESSTSIVPESESSTASMYMENEGKDSNCVPSRNVNSSDRDRHKKFVKRNTMRLLEELNELVTFGQGKRESFGTTWTTGLSEEAAKVIKKLKAVGFDDSVCSPEQYFDLDKLDSSFFSCEISDILNETLSKPLSHITSKDVESLLEKITVNSSEFENEVHSSDGFNTKEEKLCSVKQNENFINELEKPAIDQPKSSGFEEENTEGISAIENNKYDCAISEQCESKKNVTQESNVLSESKEILPKKIVQKIRTKEFRSVQKNIKSVGLTRIPKLISTTSKVPVTAKEMKQQLTNSVPNKTPFLKAQKSLKFNDIGSDVSNSKMPVTFSSGKGKPVAKDVVNIRAKNAFNKLNTRSPQLEKMLPKSESKLSSQIIKSKSAIPLKENSTESHLPRFVPKILEVPGSNLPVTSKSGVNVKRIMPKRP